MKEKVILYLFTVISISSCIWQKGEIKVEYKIPSFTVANVKLANHQFIFSGKNLNKVSKLIIKENNVETVLEIESQTSGQLVANTLNNVVLNAGRAFEFILSSANAATAFNVNFSLCDSTLNNKEFDCSITAIDKDVLSYDANLQKWIPRNINGLSYQGTFSALPGVDPVGGSVGDYYIISAAGTIGAINYVIGDWITYNGTDWEKIPNSSVITSVFSRTGVVTAAEGDYNLNQLLDVDLTTTPPVSGNVLIYNGTHWVPDNVTGGGGGGGAGTVTSVSGTPPITVASGTTTPVISIATAASGVAGALSNTAFDTFNNKLGPALSSGQVYIGNGSNVATATTLTGDVTVSNAGVTAVGAGKITNAMLAGNIDLTSKVTGALPIANGGTAATTAAGARTNLGLVIGSGVGELMAFTNSMSCLPYEKLQVSSAPYFMTCVTDNGNTNYALLAGRATGQTLNGGTAASENLTLDSTAHATKGYVLLNPTTGNVGIGINAPTSKVHVFGESTLTTGSEALNLFNMELAPTANTSAAFINSKFYTQITTDRVFNIHVKGIENHVERTMGNVKYATVLYNKFSTSNSGNSGSMNNIIGTENVLEVARSAATTTNMIGTKNTPYVRLGTLTNAYGTYNFPYNEGGGTLVNAYGTYNEAAAGFGTIGTAYGTFNTISRVGVGSVNTGYGVYVSTIDATNKWSLYAADATAPSYFAGRIGIGVTTPTTSLQVAGIIAPDANGTRDIGTSALKFKDIYATNNVIQTSDGRLKKFITNSNLGLDFINKLRPVSYRWKESIDQSLHYGLIAQETQKVLGANKNAIVIHDEASDQYGIRYTELVSPIIKAVQELYKKIVGVEEREKKLEHLVSITMKENANLKNQNELMQARLNSIEEKIKKLEAKSGFSPKTKSSQ